ncbi:hypothetical protein BV379_11820 [Rhodovulum sulfidophilum]|nr:hypothetical protein BV379_11820 [Rhodovulum sulfidophilum]
MADHGRRYATGVLLLVPGFCSLAVASRVITGRFLEQLRLLAIPVFEGAYGRPALRCDLRDLPFVERR